MKTSKKLTCSKCHKVFNESLYSKQALQAGRKVLCPMHLSPKFRPRKGGVHHG